MESIADPEQAQKTKKITAKSGKTHFIYIVWKKHDKHATYHSGVEL
jgi:hypothetical protein